MITSLVRDLIEEKAKQSPAEECCGYVVEREEGLFLLSPCRNVSPDPANSALVHPEDVDAAYLKGRVVAFYHSHPNCPSTPSAQDVLAAEELQLPCYIFSVPDDTWDYVFPEGMEPGLVMRPFVFRVHDCYALVRDYFRQTYRVRLPNFARKEDFWETGDNLFIDNFARAGFVEVEDLKPDDGLLMSIGSSPALPNHAAIYLGKNQILHHLTGRISRIDAFTGKWSRYVQKRLRHTSLCSSTSTSTAN